MTMPSQKLQVGLPRRGSISLYLFVLFLLWTFGAGTSLFFNIFRTYDFAKELAATQARTAFQKDQLYRRWCSGLGGVYVPITPKTQPNKYITEPGREIPGPDSTLLTKLNPAYMTRLVHELGEMEFGLQAHITSLRPIRPANAPDPWEEKALVTLTEGQQEEVSEVVTTEGQDYLRFIAPLVTERHCLACHAVQGYQVGQIRGGISVSLPMAPLWESAHRTVMMLLICHVALWLLGCLVLLVSARRIRQCACP